MLTFFFDLAGHTGIEGLGGLGLSCFFLLCKHDHFSGRLAILNRVVHSLYWRFAVLGSLALATSAATVFLLDRQKWGAGLGVFAVGVGLHLALEGAGGGMRAYLRSYFEQHSLGSS